MSDLSREVLKNIFKYIGHDLKDCYNAQLQTYVEWYNSECANQLVAQQQAIEEAIKLLKESLNKAYPHNILRLNQQAIAALKGPDK